MHLPSHVIPAKAGISIRFGRDEIPAFAGMTVERELFVS
jgi:hypothetical protein